MTLGIAVMAQVVLHFVVYLVRRSGTHDMAGIGHGVPGIEKNIAAQTNTEATVVSSKDMYRCGRRT